MNWADRYGHDRHWRYTSFRVRVWKFDAIGFSPFAILIVYKSWMVFFVGLILSVFFMYLEQRQIDLPNFLRRLRVRLSGYRKPVKRRSSR